MLQLVPLIGMLSGIVATFVTVAICVILALRCRERTKRPKDDNKTNDLKQHPHDHSTDSLENNPDIIPLNSGYF